MSDEELALDFSGEPQPSQLRNLLAQYTVYPAVPRLTNAPDATDERQSVMGVEGNRVSIQNQGLALEDIDPNFVTYLGYGLPNGDFSYSSEEENESEYWEIEQANAGLDIAVMADVSSPGGHVIRITPTGVTSGGAGYLKSAQVPVADTWQYACQVAVCAGASAVNGEVSIGVSAVWYDEAGASYGIGPADLPWEPVLAAGEFATRVFNLNSVFAAFGASFVEVWIELAGMAAGNPLDICSVALSSRRPYDLIVDPATGPGTGGGGSPGSFSGARAVKMSSQGINPATDEPISWLTEAYDTNAYHDTASNPSRFTVPYTGKYHINAGAQFQDATTGVVQLWIRINGTTNYWRTVLPFISGTTNERINTGGDLDLVAGDYFEVMVRHGEAGTLNVGSGNDTYVNVHLIGGIKGDKGNPGNPGPGTPDTMLIGTGGTADQTAEIQAACDAAAAAGRTVRASGIFLITSKVIIRGNFDGHDAEFRINDSALVGPAVELGVGDGTITTHVTVHFPSICQMAKVAGSGVWGASDVGLRITTVQDSHLTIGHIKGFSINLQVSAVGVGLGTVFNTFRLGHLDNGKIGLQIKPLGANSYANQNLFLGGQINLDPSEPNNIAGTRLVLIDEPATGSGAYVVDQNTFVGTSIESRPTTPGGVPEFHAEIKGNYNKFYNCRWEANPTGAKIKYTGLAYNDCYGNVVDHGYGAHAITYTIAGTVLHNTHLDRHGMRIQGSNSKGQYVGWDASGVDKPVFMALPQASTLASDPAAVYGWQAGSTSMEGKASGEAGPRWRINNTTGVYEWGDGTLPVDTSLRRDGARTLRIDHMLELGDIDAIDQDPAAAANRGRLWRDEALPGSRDQMFLSTKLADDSYAWVEISGQNISHVFRTGNAITPPALPATTHNYNPTGLVSASVLRLSASAAARLTGQQGGLNGRVLFYHNVAAQPITLGHEDGGSVDLNRYDLVGVADYVLQAREMIAIQYDGISQRWRLLGGRTAGGGGGVTDHALLTNVTADQHHAQVHAISGADHTGTLTDAQIPATIARDTEVTSAVSTHAGLADPHPGYATDTDLTTHAATAGHTHPNLATHDALGLATDAELTAHDGLANAHHTWPLTDADIPAAIARDTEVSAAVTAHEALLDPHTGYVQQAPTTYQVIQSAVSTAPLILRESAAGAGNIFAVQDAAATANRLLVTTQGATTLAPATAATIPLTLHAAPSQSANLLVIEDDAGADMFWVGPTGVAFAASSQVHTAATHGSTGDPHTQYATDADLTTHAGTSHGVTAHSALSGLLVDDHTQYRLESADHSHATTGLQGGTIAHSALTGLTAGNDHTQYERTSQKGIANGYAALDSGILVPVAQLATGTPDGTKFLRDDRVWANPPGSAHPSLATHDALGLATDAELTAHAGTPHGGGVTDHGALTGLADDDHPQYLLDSAHGGVSPTGHHAQSHNHSVAADGTALVPATLTIPAASFGTPGQHAGVGVDVGTGSLAARSNHSHGNLFTAMDPPGTEGGEIRLEAAGAFNTIHIDNNASNLRAFSAGGGALYINANSTADAPTTAAFGDTASGGTTGRLAYAGHRHGMPANPVTGLAHSALSGLANDDHPQYRLESADHTHASTGLQGGTVAHSALTGLLNDEHTQYQKESEKGIASGYAALDSGIHVPVAQLGSGTPSASTLLNGAGVWIAGVPVPLYEENPWVPVLTFATPTGLSVTYSVQQGVYTRIGRMVFARCNIVTSSFTHASSGDLRITGLPYNVTLVRGIGSCAMGGWTSAAVDWMSVVADAGTNYMAFVASRTASGIANVTAAFFPTGGLVNIRAELAYSV